MWLREAPPTSTLEKKWAEVADHGAKHKNDDKINGLEEEGMEGMKQQAFSEIVCVCVLSDCCTTLGS